MFVKRPLLSLVGKYAGWRSRLFKSLPGKGALEAADDLDDVKHAVHGAVSAAVERCRRLVRPLVAGWERHPQSSGTRLVAVHPGLSPTVTGPAARNLHSDTVQFHKVGGGGADRDLDLPVKCLDLGVECLSIGGSGHAARLGS